MAQARSAPVSGGVEEVARRIIIFPGVRVERSTADLHAVIVAAAKFSSPAGKRCRRKQRVPALGVTVLHSLHVGPLNVPANDNKRTA